MRIRLSDPSLVDDLLGALREGGAEARRRCDDTIEVEPFQPRVEGQPPNQDEVELAFFVEVWRRKHPDVECEIFE